MASLEHVAAAPRPDGRTGRMLRPMRCERGLLQRADGSARFSQQRTAVLVAVFGPCEVKKRREELDRATLEVVVRPPAGPPGPREREMEAQLHGLFAPLIVRSLHPRSAISIVAQIVEDDGGALACAINCAAIALADAGVAMRCIPTAVSLALSVEGPTRALLDPCRSEEAAAAGALTLACASTPAALAGAAAEGCDDRPALALVACTGDVDADELDAHVRLAQGSHALVGEFAKRVLRERLCVE
jgi:exosome complex component RRP46